MQTKICSNCKIEKEVEKDFYVARKVPLTYAYYCKSCIRQKSAFFMRKGYDPVKEKKKSLKRKTEGKLTENYKRMTKKYPEKYRARYILGNAIRLNKIKKLPCELCGVVKVEAHHPDYTKPLEVKWLCTKHHKELHSKYHLLQSKDTQHGGN